MPDSITTTTGPILVVDDDDAVRAVAVRQLTSLGYRTIDTNSGARALELLDRTPDVELLFVDLSMPGGLDGREVAERALSSHPDLKVLFASGNVDGDLPGAAPQIIVKPYRKKDLAERLREVLGAAAN